MARVDAVTSGAEAIARAMQKSVDYLFAVQRADGSWRDELSSSAIATGAALVAMFLADRVGMDSYLREGASWLRSTQHSDGGWGDAVVDPGNLNGTAIAVAALQLVEPGQSRDAIERGMAFIEQRGGFEALKDKTLCTLSGVCLTLLALAGLYPWEQLAVIPLELILLPNGLKRKLSITLPGVVSWGLMHTHMRSAHSLRHALLQKIAEPRALRWLEEAQAHDGGFEESPLMASLVYIGLSKAGVGREIAARCLSYVLSTRRSNGSWAIDRDLEFSVTTDVLLGLEAAGYLADRRLDATISWILDAQRPAAFAATGCPAGGWGWSLPSGWPNSDDTGLALFLLPRMGVSRLDQHIQKGYRWLLNMQNKDGSWACFVRNGLVSLDQPCPAFTAHAILGLHESAGYGPEHPMIQRTRRYYERIQREDGAVHALWYRDFVSGTAFTLEMYAVLGILDDPVARKCREWLLKNQNDDGSWGGSYGVPGTVEETAWALAALLESGSSVEDERMHQAALWLASMQQEDGSWKPSVVGLYFCALHYSSDHIANGFALQALGRYQQRMQPLSAQTFSLPGHGPVK